MSNLINTKHILSIMVDNEPGVLARVVGLFSGRGYNIESLSVSEVDSDKFLSRVTIVTSGTKIIVDQIKAQLKKLIPVHDLIDITELDKISKDLSAKSDNFSCSGIFFCALMYVLYRNCGLYFQ